MTMRSKLRCLLLAVIFLAGCGAFPSSNYELAPESRLPRWVRLREGLSSADVRVAIWFYAPPLDSGNTVVDFVDRRNGRRLARVTGNAVEHPASTSSYPRWSIVSINGVVEVLEFRQVEPIFYITDDSILVQQAIEASKSPASAIGR